MCAKKLAKKTKQRSQHTVVLFISVQCWHHIAG